MSGVPFNLERKVALITGAATGLGAAIAVALAKAGADVAITDRPGESLDNTACLARKYDRCVFTVEMESVI